MGTVFAAIARGYGGHAIDTAFHVVSRVFSSRFAGEGVGHRLLIWILGSPVQLFVAGVDRCLSGPGAGSGGVSGWIAHRASRVSSWPQSEDLQLACCQATHKVLSIYASWALVYQKRPR